MGKSPSIYQDRIPVAQLQNNHSSILELMRQHNIGKTEERGTVHFCGLAWSDNSKSCVFIPRMSGTDTPGENLKTAKLTMSVLARFGREGFSTGGVGNTGLLATISELVSDFRSNGIFTERIRYRSRNSGKPDWSNTIVRELAFIGTNGDVVYPEIRTSKALDSHDNPLARIQAAILKEITRHHGWWLEGVSGREAELNRYLSPDTPRILWAHKLRALLPELFATRAIMLANLLIGYLENSKNRTEGAFLYGVEDFHTIWEHMLRKVIPGVEEGWNSRLPRPAYVRTDKGEIDTQERGMQTDIIVKRNNAITVVDAKYYDATTVKLAPGWSDIVKQFFYDVAIGTVKENHETVSGCFVFPAQTDNKGPFSSIVMVDREGNKTTGVFPDINCLYLDIRAVMVKYVAGETLELQATDIF